LLHRAHASARRLAHQHELPRASDLGLDENDFKKHPPLAVRRRSITRYAITETISRVPLSTKQLASTGKNSELVWVALDQLAALTLSGPHRRWVGEILAGKTK
jgi:A/G-specific adenine glycosylase